MTNKYEVFFSNKKINEEVKIYEQQADNEKETR